MCITNSWCISWATDPGWMVLFIILSFAVVLLGMVLGTRIAGYLLEKNLANVVVGSMLAIGGIGFVVLSQTNAESTADTVGFLGLAAFVGILGLMMLFLPTRKR